MQRIIYPDETGFTSGIQDWFGLIFENQWVIHHMSRIKKTMYLNRCKKALNKNQYPLTTITIIIATHGNLWIKGKFLNLTKGFHDQPTTKIILSGERLNTSHQLGQKQECSFIPLLFNIILALLASKIMQRK